MVRFTDYMLEVIPEGDVVVDMGHIRGFRANAEVTTETGEIQKIWVGSLKTSGDLTVRTVDSRESIKFHQYSQ